MYQFSTGFAQTSPHSEQTGAAWRLNRFGVKTMNQSSAAHAARTAYVKALAIGASAHTAFDVACAAYRASWPGLDDSELRHVVARTLALTSADRVAAADF
jgi:hypothetical protein